jgi:hypothetical protein
MVSIIGKRILRGLNKEMKELGDIYGKKLKPFIAMPLSGVLSFRSFWTKIMAIFKGFDVVVGNPPYIAS